MRSADGRLAKNAIQSACEYLEENPHSRRETVAMFQRSLSTQLASNDILVQRWTYKLTAILDDEAYVPYLLRRLAVDPVKENRTWIVAALSGLGRDVARDIMNSGDDYGVSYQLAAMMYGHHDIAGNLSRATNSGDPLSLQWLGLLYGQGRIVLDAEILRDLTACGEAVVAEYAIWGLRRQPHPTIAMVAFAPEELSAQPANVRRWYYRLMSTSVGSMDAYCDTLMKAIEDEVDSKAREGLARAVSEASLRSPFWEDVRKQWLRDERDVYSRIALTRQYRRSRLLEETVRKTAFVERQLSLFGTFDRRSFFAMNIDNSVNIGANNSPVGKIFGSGSIDASIGGTSVPTAVDLLRRLQGDEFSPKVRTLAEEAIADSSDPGTFWARVKKTVEALQASASLSESGARIVEGLGALLAK